jgi:PAS domain S-box-containing protein
MSGGDPPEQGLYLSELDSLSVLDLAPSAIVAVDRAGLIVFANAQTQATFGYERAELCGAPLATLVPSRYQGVHAAHVEEYFRQPRLRPMGGALALVGLRKSGEEFPVEIALSPIWSADRGPLVVAAIRDTTLRKQADDARAEAHARLEAVLSCAPDYVLMLDRRGIIQFANRARPPDTSASVRGKPWLDFAPADQHPALQAALDSVLDAGDLATVDISVPRDDGTTTHFAIQLGPVRREGEVCGAVLIARDVTARKRAEAQLLTADRMASIGMLAAGIAHEINNPLALVTANLEIACRELDAARARGGTFAELAALVADAREGAERIRAIVRDVKTFSRAEDATLRSVDVVRCMESAVRVASADLRHRARVVTRYRTVPPVQASESQLGQVLLNLLVNALQALPEGQSDVNEVRLATRQDDDGWVVIEVGDTGPGMSPEVLRRIFTPFYTTKPPGVGTGLGLPICRRILDEMGGRIEVESRVGAGTVFRVFLRPAPTKVEHVGASPDVAALPTGARGRVLVVDDEPAMGALARRILGAKHDVVAFTEAAEALACIAAGERFDAIVCDLMMPRMTGMDLHAAVIQAAPEQAERMLFVTGGAFTPRAREFLEGVENAHLEKPFDARQLLELVNERVRASRG